MHAHFCQADVSISARTQINIESDAEDAETVLKKLENVCLTFPPIILVFTVRVAQGEEKER